jgi:hypothetical protein
VIAPGTGAATRGGGGGGRRSPLAWDIGKACFQLWLFSTVEKSSTVDPKRVTYIVVLLNYFQVWKKATLERGNFV